MIVMCCGENHIGDRFIREKEPLEDKRISHGLCPNCFNLALAESEQPAMISERSPE